MELRREPNGAVFWKRFENLWSRNKQRGGEYGHGEIDQSALDPSMEMGESDGEGELEERTFGGLVWRSRKFDDMPADHEGASSMDMAWGGGYQAAERSPAAAAVSRVNPFMYLARAMTPNRGRVMGDEDRPSTMSSSGASRSSSSEEDSGSDEENGVLLRAWNAMLASPTYRQQRQLSQGQTTPKVGFVEASRIVAYDYMRSQWTIADFQLPKLTAIHSCWSAGPNLLVKLRSLLLAPSPTDAIYLWNPLRSTLSALPPFESIAHVTTLGFGANTIVAIGPNHGGHFAIELLLLSAIHRATKWQQFGVLPHGYFLPPHADVVESHGSFYTLCINPHGSMLEIKKDAPWIVPHLNLPACDMMPKLVVCANTIFLVETTISSEHYKLWRFQPECRDNPWGLYLVDVPDYGGDLRFVSVRGVGGLLFFFFPCCETFILDLDSQTWHRLPDCPIQPTMFPITWEEKAPDGRIITI